MAVHHVDKIVITQLEIEVKLVITININTGEKNKTF